jgi:hypothetical protein
MKKHFDHAVETFRKGVEFMGGFQVTPKRIIHTVPDDPMDQDQIDRIKQHRAYRRKMNRLRSEFGRVIKDHEASEVISEEQEAIQRSRQAVENHPDIADLLRYWNGKYRDANRLKRIYQKLSENLNEKVEVLMDDVRQLRHAVQPLPASEIGPHSPWPRATVDVRVVQVPELIDSVRSALNDLQIDLLDLIEGVDPAEIYTELQALLGKVTNIKDRLEPSNRT